MSCPQHTSYSSYSELGLTKVKYLLCHDRFSQANKECRNTCPASFKDRPTNSGFVTNDAKVFVVKNEVVGLNDVIGNAAMNNRRCRRFVERRILEFPINT